MNAKFYFAESDLSNDRGMAIEIEGRKEGRIRNSMSIGAEKVGRPVPAVIRDLRRLAVWLEKNFYNDGG